MRTGGRAVRHPEALIAARIVAGEEHLAVVDCHVVRCEPRSIRPDDAGQLARARGRAVRHPETVIAARVVAGEEHFAVVDRQPKRIEPSRRRPGDAGQLVRACGRAVRFPQTVLAARVEAGEPNLAIIECEVGCDKTGNDTHSHVARPGAHDAGQLVGTGGRAVRHPEPGVAAQVSAGKENDIRKHGAPPPLSTTAALLSAAAVELRLTSASRDGR